MSNIAEGKGRLSDRDSLRFFGNARGSLFEIESQIDVAERLSYMSAVEAGRLRSATSETGKLLNGLIKCFNSGTEVKV